MKKMHQNPKISISVFRRKYQNTPLQYSDIVLSFSYLSSAVAGSDFRLRNMISLTIGFIISVCLLHTKAVHLLRHDITAKPTL